MWQIKYMFYANWKLKEQKQSCFCGKIYCKYAYSDFVVFCDFLVIKQSPVGYFSLIIILQYIA